MKRTQLKRGTPLARGSKGLTRKAKLRPRNPARRQSEWERCYLSKAFVRFTKGSACAACGYRSPLGSDCAHTITDGMSRKAGWETVIPLCAGPQGCHARQHRLGWRDLGMTAEGRQRAAQRHRAAFADHQARILNGGDEE